MMSCEPGILRCMSSDRAVGTIRSWSPLAMRVRWLTDERERLWSRLVETYADFESYQSWTDRERPVLVLNPR
jgi:hypothetical protein